MVKRRTLLASVSTVGTVAIAGCGGSSDDDVSADVDDDIDAGEEEEEEEEDSVTEHEIGDTFTVGEGSEVIEYTVTGTGTAEAIGDEFTQEVCIYPEDATAGTA